MTTIAMIGVLLMITAFAVNFIGQELTEQVVEQLLYFIINLVVLTIIFYIAGRIVVGKKRALFSDAFLISLLGTVVLNVCVYFFESSAVGLILSLIVWLLLIRHYYETGLLGSITVGIIAMIVSVIIMFIIMVIIFGSSLILFGSFSLF